MKIITFMAALITLIAHSTTAQQTLEKSITEDSETREYILYVPSSYDGNSPTPMIINYHGFGGSDDDFSSNVGEYYGLHSIADANNFMVAYPQGSGGVKGDSYWDPGTDGGQNIGENDTYFTERLIAHVNSEYNLDTSRVYATGYSNGGMMSYGLACNLTNKIAAIGIMSGAFLSGDIPPENEYIPVIHFHGIADDVLPYEGNQYYDHISETMNFWIDHNGIDSSTKVTTNLNNGDVVREEYTGGNENSSVVLYTVHEEQGKAGGHVWFSGDIDGTSPNQILWDFLSQYNLDGSISTPITNWKSIGAMEKNEILLQVSSNSLILETKFNNDQSYKIFSLDGKVVSNGIVKSRKHHINISGLSPNIYFLKVNDQVLKLNLIE